MEELTVEEYAALSGETTRNVRYAITAGTLTARETRGRGGAGGKSFLIPVSSLDPKLKKKYDRLKRQQEADPAGGTVRSGTGGGGGLAGSPERVEGVP